MRQLEPVLESRLAAVLMGELLRPREDLDDTFVDIVLDDLELDEPDEFYASYELVRELDLATTQFVRVRDTTRDHVVTVKYPRIEPEPAPVYSAPYERIDIAVRSSDALPLPLYSAPFERVDIQDVTPSRDWSFESTEVVAVPSSHVGLIITVLLCALAVGFAIVRLAI